MDVNNSVIKLCIAGTQAEFEGRFKAAFEFYRQAWETSTNDYEACIAAHYVARCQESPEEGLRWNSIALERAEVVNDGSVREYYPSLYLNLGRSYELLGYQDEAAKFYALAAALGATRQMD